MPKCILKRGRGRPAMRTALLTLAVLQNALASRVTAQARSADASPFSTFAMRASVLRPAGIGALAPYYRAESGGLLEVETPFEAGRLGLTFGWMGLRGRPGALTGAIEQGKVIPAQIIGLTWRFPLLQRGRLSASAGLRTSTFRLRLPDSLISKDDRTEDELSLGATTQLEFAVSRRTSIVLGGDVARVWANVPWRLTTLSAGMSWRGAMPPRVRDWLR